MTDKGKRINRRGLLSLFGMRGAEQDVRKSFSLDTFYRRREEDAAGGGTLPKFSLREGLPDAGEWSTKLGVADLVKRASLDDESE